MKPQELRIGNLVRIRATKQIAEVTAINKLGVEVNDNNLAPLRFSEIEPVLLTKEILRGFGCNTVYLYLSVSNLKAELHFEIYPSEVVTSLKSQFSDLMLDPLVYAHQLQNLYYVLTNEELTQKESYSLESQRNILCNFTTWYNAKPKVKKSKDGMITTSVIEEYLQWKVQ